MQGLLDFLQGASNSAASNVSAPVDGLAWLLRKAGLPIPANPVGGSDWMAEKGLTAQPKNKNMGLLGEAIGGVAPIVAAAKAPQIAKGLLQMEANAMAPRTLNPQTGAIVWHGSPHKFDKFDASKIGTGEGAQAYGHGLYLAESPDVAGSYVQSVKANSSELASRGKAHGLPDDVSSNLIAALQSGKKFDPVMESARKMVADPLAGDAQKQAAQRLLDNEMPAYNAWSEWSKPGSLYKVDLPDEHIAKMLDWDKPLSQQPEVTRALRRLGVPAPLEMTGGDLIKSNYLKGLSDDNGVVMRGEDALRQKGIPGIRYLDGGSRGTGAGTSNFVVFPGNEGLLNILERNGQPLR